jgi:hypothetical protein
MSGAELDLAFVRNLALGVALAAACGLRIFVPLLVLGVASTLGWVELFGGFTWIGSAPALTVFGVATLVEIAAYHVPWLDNALDYLGAPVAVGAGTLMAASLLPEGDALLRWTVAAAAGGGAAGTVHLGTAVLRKMSSLGTGGLANPLLALAEAFGALVVSVVALAIPMFALAVVFLLIVGAARLLRRRTRPPEQRSAT